jgi:hypothetical protein
MKAFHLPVIISLIYCITPSFPLQFSKRSGFGPFNNLFANRLRDVRRSNLVGTNLRRGEGPTSPPRLSFRGKDGLLLPKNENGGFKLPVY